MLARVWRIVWVVALMAMAFVTPSHAAQKQLSTVYYKISGNTEKELLVSIARNSGFNRFHALTTWYVDWRFNWQTRGGACRLHGVKVGVHIKITMPKLASEKGMPRALVRKWNAYSKALMGHEQGHVRIGEAAAREVEKLLAGYSQPSGCNGVEAKVNRAAAAVTQRGQQRDRDYDRQTRHGATQGAYFR